MVIEFRKFAFRVQVLLEGRGAISVWGGFQRSAPPTNPPISTFGHTLCLYFDFSDTVFPEMTALHCIDY